MEPSKLRISHPFAAQARSWSRPADAFAAFEAATAPRRGLRLSPSKRFWLISDVHVDSPCNWLWLQQLPPRPEDTSSAGARPREGGTARATALARRSRRGGLIERSDQ